MSRRAHMNPYAYPSDLNERVSHAQTGAHI